MCIKFDNSIVFCRALSALGLTCACLMCGSVAAQCSALQTAKLLSDDGVAGDVFGISSAINGNMIIVGAFTNDNGDNSGAAYLFDLTTGQQTFKLLPDDGTAGDLFGNSVAFSGTTAIVGARGDDGVATSSGSAYLFDTGTGQQIAKLLPDAGGSAVGADFGLSVAISGTTAIVGARWEDTIRGSESGAAYLFDATTGNQIRKLLASDGQAFDSFGVSVAISGNTAIIGQFALGDRSSAYLFNTTTGQQLYKWEPADVEPNDFFGFRVAISGTTAIVGSSQDDDNGTNAGAAYVFDVTTGQQRFKLLASDGAAGDTFGGSIAIDGNTAIIGAPGDDDNGSSSGSAYVFDLTTGQEIAKILPNDGAWSDGFGRSVGISGAKVIVGADADDDNGENSGSAYLFDANQLICPVHFEYSNGLPLLVDSGGGTSIRVVAVNGGGEPQPNTGILHVDRGNGYESFPMTQVSAHVYDAIFPTSNCGSFVNYYFSAESVIGERFTDPVDAPDSTFSTVSATEATLAYVDDFETDLGWTVSGDATDGHWDRGVPVGDGTRGDPLSDADGSGSCYLTDNVDGNSDVDNGSTVLTSPILDATGPNPFLSYYRWYSNRREEDTFVVEISNDGGVSWTNLETVGPSGPEVRGGWILKTIRIGDFVAPTDQMRVRFIASDNDPQTVVEAGVDGVAIRFISCSGPAIVVPDSLLVTRGTYVAGGVGELAASDNLDLSLRRATVDIQSRTEFEVKAISAVASPSSLEVTLEGSVFARSQVNQTIELYDYVAGPAGQWEPVDTRPATRFTDSTVTVAAAGDLSRFVEAGTMCIKARIRYQSVIPRQQFSSNTDQFMWTIGQ